MKVFGTGFRYKKGIGYGFYSINGKEIELVFLEYRRVKVDKKMLKNIKEHVDFKEMNKRHGIDNAEDYYANEMLIKELIKREREPHKVYGIPETNREMKRDYKMIYPRLGKWTKWLAKKFEK